MSNRKVHIFIILSLLVFAFFAFSHADWGRWGTGEDGIAICDETSEQDNPIIISDLDSGAVIVWVDKRSGGLDIYAQGVDINGDTQWTDDGVGICTATGSQQLVRAVTDDAGGGIVVWMDYRTSGKEYIYAQRVNSIGQTLWDTNGVCIDTTKEAISNSAPVLAPDNSGGAIIAWSKDPDDIYAQRINSNGVFQWNNGGVCICDASEKQYEPEIVPDGNGGAIIAWLDARDGGSNDIYAQKIDSDSVVQWTSNGIAIYDSTYGASYLKILPDRNGGAIITWIDSRDGATGIWGQHVNADSTTDWVRNGTKIDSIQGIAYDVTIDSLGGAIIAYRKTRGSDYRLFAARIAANGNKILTTAVSPSGSYTHHPKSCADSAGGAIIVWENLTDEDIYCQRLNNSGNIQWGSSGVLVCDASNEQNEPDIVFNGDWDAIIAWKDKRNTNWDIYAQRIEAPMPSCSLNYAYSDTTIDCLNNIFMRGCPAGDLDTLKVTINFDDEDMLRDIDSFEITLDKPDTLFEFWNEGSIIAGSDATKDNGYTTTITHFYFSRANETDKSCHSLDIPTRFIRFNNDPIDSLYDFMEKSPDRNGDGKVGLSDLAIFGETYNKCISDDEFDCWFKFHSGDTCVNLSDFALMGVHKLHEYDPPQQLKTPNEESTSGLIVQLEGETITEGDIEKHLITIYLENIVGNKLLFMGLDYDRNILAFNKWNPNPSFPNRSAVAPISDHHGGDWLATAAFKLDCYSTSNIELGTLEFIVKNSSMTIDEDDIWINFADVLEENGKESKIYGLKYYPDEEGPTLTTRLAGNYPNPFNPSTVIEYSIAKGAHVNLSIYNVNGQLVCTLVDEFQKRNTYKRVWDGRNNRGITVASGVYFLKMKTESCVMTKKLVILR